MMATSLYQPSASFVAYGLERFVIQNWWTDYRGPILIHAAKTKMNKADCALAAKIFRSADWRWKFAVPYGAFVCIVDLQFCLPAAAAGCFVWELANVRRIVDPVEARGRPRFWDYDVVNIGETVDVAQINAGRVA